MSFLNEHHLSTGVNLTLSGLSCHNIWNMLVVSQCELQAHLRRIVPLQAKKVIKLVNIPNTATRLLLYHTLDPVLMRAV
jgi:hypothetical protein